MKIRSSLSALLFVLAAALESCSGGSSTPVAPIIGAPSTTATTSAPTSTPTGAPASAAPTLTPPASATPTATASAAPTPTISPTPMPTPTAVPTATPTSASMAQVYGCNYTSGANDPGSFTCLASTGVDPGPGVYFSAYQSTATGDPNNLSAVNVAVTFGNANPGNFSVPGPVISYMQGTLTDTPATITYRSNQSNIFIQYSYGGVSSAPPGLPAAGTPVTCSLFEDSKLLSHGVGEVENDSIACYAYSSPPAGGMDVGAQYVYITMPPQYDVGHPYTMIVSQGTPAPSASPMVARGRHL